MIPENNPKINILWRLFMVVAILFSFTGIAQANASITTATGGNSVASNTAPGCMAAGTWTSLTGPILTEGAAGDIHTGTIVLSAPAGFQFNSAASVTILISGSNTSSRNINGVANGTSVAVSSITATAITFTVTSVSLRTNTLTWQGIQVQPTASTPLASGNITNTGTATITGLTSSSNYGTLKEVTSSPACTSAPSVTTNAVSSISSSGATLNGTVSSNGLSSTVSFNYGTTTSYGSSVPDTPISLAGSASNTAVSAAITGLSCGTTYHYQVTATNSAGTSNGSDMTFQTSNCPLSCTQPSNTPPSLTLTCQCDTFARTTLNPSTIFNSNWTVSTSDATGILPSIVNSGYLRLTNNTASNAKAATVPGIFPAAGNYISVEFVHYAYNGSGADGIAVILSDYAVPAVPGAFGGSLGYAQKSNPGSDCTTTGGCPGFTGGWLGVALDEYGNYQNPTEGRIGGPGAVSQSVGLRGSGSGMNGYQYLAGTSSLTPQVDNAGSTSPLPGYYYQVIVDARKEPSSTSVSVNRDTTGTGNSYTSLINLPNIYTAATTNGFTQSAVPNNWQVSFTGSTGGANNIHEIGGLRICAQYFVPPSGGTAGSFNAIDSAYGTPPLAVQNYLTGHIYTKLVGTPFNLSVAALSNSQILTTYAITGAKTVTVKLVDNSDSLSGSTDCSLSCTAACLSKTAITGGTNTISFVNGASDKGQKQSPSFTINSAYQKLVAIISDGTSSACSTDSFSVRPLSIASVTSSNATNTGTSGTPIFKAGSDTFSLTATTTGVNGSPSLYTGVMKINNSIPITSISLTAASSPTYTGIVSPRTFPAAISGTPSSTATGTGTTGFTYSEVGGFTLPVNSVYEGVVSTVDCVSMTTTACDAVKASTWTGVDSISTKGDCVADSFSNTISAAGLYGCNFGNASASTFGRFVPDHFDTVITQASGVPMACPPVGMTCPLTYNGFVYSSEPFTANIYARNAAGTTTQNYDTSTGFSRAVTLTAWDALGSVVTQNPNGSSTALANSSILAAAFSTGIAALNTASTEPSYTFTTVPTVPTSIYIRANETYSDNVKGDGVTSLRSTPSASIEGGVAVASGQLKVSNAYGSELLPLTLTATAQFYNSSSVWTTSTTDSVTSLTFPATYSVLTSGGTTNVTKSPSTGILSSGVLTINLSKPTIGAGTATVAPTGVVPSYLPLTPGVATFGIYKGNNSIIYMRENY